MSVPQSGGYPWAAGGGGFGSCVPTRPKGAMPRATGRTGPRGAAQSVHTAPAVRIVGYRRSENAVGGRARRVHLGLRARSARKAWKPFALSLSVRAWVS